MSILLNIYARFLCKRRIFLWLSHWDNVLIWTQSERAAGSTKQSPHVERAKEGKARFPGFIKV